MLDIFTDDYIEILAESVSDMSRSEATKWIQNEVWNATDYVIPASDLLINRIILKSSELRMQ